MSSLSPGRRMIVVIALLVLFVPLFLLARRPNVVQAVSTDVVINQIYGAGGNVGASRRNDYVELFNRGNETVSLNGLSIQYAGATNVNPFSNNPVVLLSGNLAPGQYYLVQLGGNSAGNGTPLPTPDATGTTNLGAGDGKVALVNGTSGLECNGGNLPCNAEQLNQIKDLVGYGGANFFEGTGPAPGAGPTTAIFRAEAGCSDTDSNSADFSTGTPNPRNSSTAASPCGGVTPSETPTETTTATPSETPTETSTTTPSETPTETSTVIASETPTQTSTTNPSETPTQTRTGTVIASETPTQTRTGTIAPTNTGTSTTAPTGTSTSTVTATPTQIGAAPFRLFLPMIMRDAAPDTGNGARR